MFWYNTLLIWVLVSLCTLLYLFRDLRKHNETVADIGEENWLKLIIATFFFITLWVIIEEDILPILVKERSFKK